MSSSGSNAISMRGSMDGASVGASLDAAGMNVSFLPGRESVCVCLFVHGC